MNIGYDCIPVMRECYDALYDDLSKQLFFARMAVNAAGSWLQICNSALL